MNALLRTHWLKSVSDILHHDFCPTINHWVYWLKNPMWTLLLAAVGSALCGIFVNPQVFVLTAILGLVFGLGVVWPRIVVRGLECRVYFQNSRTREGHPVAVRIRITNRWPWPVWGLALEQGFAVSDVTELHGAGESMALSRVSGWSTCEYTWSFVPQRRGVYPLTQPAIETGFPFGLVRARKLVHSENELLVWPRTVMLKSLPDTFDQAPVEDQLTDRHAGDFGDMLGTRPFRQGDSLRRVHWAQTARYGRMIVCERQAPSACSVRVVADLRSTVHTGTGSSTTLEQVLRVTASVCESLRAQRASVECAIGREVVVVGSSEADWKRLLDLLALVPAEGLKADQRPTRQRRSMSEIVVTSDAGWAEASHLHSAASRTIVVRESGLLNIENGDRPWLDLPSASADLDSLSGLWGRACHAA